MPCKGKADTSGTVSQRSTGLYFNMLPSPAPQARKQWTCGQNVPQTAQVSGMGSLKHKHTHSGQRRTSRQGVRRVWRVVSHELLPLNSCDPPDQEVA